MDIVLKVDDLILKRSGTSISWPLSFSIKKGESLLITGPNGSGKTTLLRTLAGITPSSEKAQKFATYFYLGHQDALHEEQMVFDYLSCNLNNTPVYQELQLGNILHLQIRSLSKGQRKILSLLRLLNVGRCLWLLDEPFANLDSHHSQWLIKVFKAHLLGKGAILATSHENLPLEFSQTLTLKSIQA